MKDSCPICAGPLDVEGLCPSCVEGMFDGPALAADGSLELPDPRPAGAADPPRRREGTAVPPAPRGGAPVLPGHERSRPIPPPDRTLPPIRPAPDPGHGVPLELDLSSAPAASRDDPLELDDRALAPIEPRSATGVAAAVPVERRSGSRRRRWPWLLALAAALALAWTTGHLATGYRHAAGLVEGLLTRLPDGLRLPGTGTEAGERVLAPGLGGEILLVDSDPPGARVYLGAEFLGETPLAVDNPYPDGEPFEITVKKAGYLEAHLAATGGGPAHLRVTLVPAGRQR